MFDIFGYVASILVFVAFRMKTTVPPRLVGRGNNVAFLLYARGLNLRPVFVLHFAINLRWLHESIWLRAAPSKPTRAIRLSASASNRGNVQCPPAF
jgi:hypothetical protein